MNLNLKDLQALHYELIVSPKRTITNLSAATAHQPGWLETMVRGDERLSALRRLEIYVDAYFYRLLDCLKEDFPATAAVIGDPAFEDLIRAYLTRHPPTEPSIFYAGRHLADFLADHGLRQRWPFLAELARLERTLIEVLHSPDAPVLSASEMNSFYPEDWSALRLHSHPVLRLLDCRWRVNDVLRAVEDGGQWKQPELRPVLLLVWRQGAQVYYRELEAPERAALEAASRGADFASVCEVFASWFDGENPAAVISQTLARWLADGLLVRA
jgi:hypothetical protein